MKHPTVMIISADQQQSSPSLSVKLQCKITDYM